MDRAPAGNRAAVRQTFGALDALTVEDARHATRELLAGLAGSASGEWVLPGRDADGPLNRNEYYRFWRGVR